MDRSVRFCRDSVGLRCAPVTGHEGYDLRCGLVKKWSTRKNAFLEGVLPLDGSRFSGSIPPLSPAPSFNIRKKAIAVFTLEDYLEKKGTLTTEQMACLHRAIQDRKKNIMVVGGTGSGKTTFLNAMLDSVAKKTPADRIMLIQDTDEIQCNAANYEALMTVPKVYDMEDLLRHTMRRSPGRIIVGEVRGPEAHALVKAWNTGHPGGLGTIHADSAVEGLTRIEDLIEENPNRRAKPWNIAQAVNVLVYIEKEETGQRRRMVKKNVLRVKGYDKVAQKNTKLKRFN
ncbi:ATPase, T2SS/T4P/T4SS family [Undibacterium arcticum]